MPAPTLITGGTGTLGTQVVRRLLGTGADLRILSRKIHDPEHGVEYVVGDLVKDQDVQPALIGVRTVVHLAGGATGDDEIARHLVRTAARSDVEHIVFVSVTAADRVPLAYLRSKSHAEQVLIESCIPYSILRAAQFHDLVLKVAAGMARLPVIPRPGGLRLQPVASDEVAARLVDLALDGPAGRVADLVGPEVIPLADLVRSYLEATGRRRPMLPVTLPGKAGRAYRAGDNLVLEDASLGEQTWAEFLTDTLDRRHRVNG